MGKRLDQIKASNSINFPVITTTPFLDKDIVRMSDGTYGYVWYKALDFDGLTKDKYWEKTTHTPSHSRSMYMSKYFEI